MTDSPPSRYASPAAFRPALKQALQDQAQRSARQFNELQREFLLQRFLARVFHQDTTQWVLKGGIGLLIRLPSARFSRDLDLFNREIGVQEAIADLRRCAAITGLDPFAFQLSEPKPMTGGVTGVTVTVQAFLGTTLYGSFPIDLSTNLDPLGRIDILTPEPVITLADVSAPPPIQIYPVPDQIADKVCAMYTRYGTLAAPSGRFHDLVDLVLITSSCQIDAAELSRSLTQQAAIRDLQLPAELQPPGPAWTGGYPRAAEQASTLSAELRNLAAALAAAGRCLNPILSGVVTAGIWQPQRLEWTSRPARPAANRAQSDA